MSLKPLIAGMSQTGAAGGGGAPSGPAGGGLSGTYPNPSVNPQLPAWTYTAGTIGDGLFTTDTVDIASTTRITIDDPTHAFRLNNTTAILVLVDESGDYVTLYAANGISAATQFLGPIQGGTATGNWSGKYTFAFIPTDLATAAQGAKADDTKAAMDGAFSGSGIYTSFTFVNGLCTAAS